MLGLCLRASRQLLCALEWQKPHALRVARPSHTIVTARIASTAEAKSQRAEKDPGGHCTLRLHC